MAVLAKIYRKIRRYCRSIRDFCRFLRLEKFVGRNTCVLISHSADSTGGASVVLFELAQLLRQRGYDVLFLSQATGGLLESCQEAGICAFLTCGFHSLYLKRLASRHPRCFVVNTVVCCDSVEKLQQYSNTPIYWWLHEETHLIEAYRDRIPHIRKTQTAVLCVSQRVRAALCRTHPELEEHTAILFYGCRDLSGQQARMRRQGKFVISSVGRLCRRKNQLQLVEAVEGLPEEIRKDIQVQFVYGSADSSYERKLREAIREKPGYRMAGNVPRERIAELYIGTDLLVCTSLDDPLPVVITEAMMLGCPFVLSSETGQYALVRSGENGYTYDVCDVQQLRCRILEAYSHKEAPTTVTAARACYEQHFSLPVLERNFFAIFDKEQA